MKAATYDLVLYDAEEERERDPVGPQRANLFAAATVVGQVLSQNGVVYAAMGGFAMVCRGSVRDTRDVDIVVAATMRELWELVENEPRFKIPNTRLIEGVIKIFVETGPKYEDPGCFEDRWIEVDLMTSGFKGTPTQIPRHLIQLPVEFRGEQLVVPCLDILYMMRSKIRNCVTRGMKRDFEDVQYLLTNFGTEVSQVWMQLNQEEVDQLLELDWMVGPRRLGWSTIDKFWGGKRSLPWTLSTREKIMDTAESI